MSSYKSGNALELRFICANFQHNNLVAMNRNQQKHSMQQGGSRLENSYSDGPFCYVLAVNHQLTIQSYGKSISIILKILITSW